ncbi:MAG: hypothetical protein JWM47_174 [Acidimicrobiales bacterium]|nr:hypothetical protein [Acidimicrobiales bacterium]
MESVPEYQHEYQGDEARGYEERRTRDQKWLNEDAALAELLDLAAAAPSSLLDIPVGTGRFLPHYAQRGHTVVGADISDDMLGVAAEKLAGLDDHHITLEHQDITKLSHGDDTFDLAVCVRLLNLVDVGVVEAAVAELARVSRSHLIIGLRTYDLASAPYQLLRRTRNRLTGHTPKVVAHPAGIVDRLATSSGMTLKHKVEIDRGARRASIYHFYLFELAGPS